MILERKIYHTHFAAPRRILTHTRHAVTERTKTAEDLGRDDK